MPVTPVETSPPERSLAASKRTWRLALLLVALCLAVAHLPIFFGQIVFFRDLAHWNFPSRWFLRASARAGDWPTWDPLRGLGLSTFTNPLYGLFYPPNWLFAAGGATLATGMLTWQCLAHLIGGAAGVFFVARRIGGQAAGACVAALAWGLCGYTTSQWSAGFLLFADAWVPWITLGCLCLLDDFRRGMGLASAWKVALPVAAVFLLGEFFLAMIGAGFASMFSLVLLVLWREPGMPALRIWWLLGLALALSLGVGMGAVALIPAWMGAQGTDRAAPLLAAVAEACSVHPLRLIEFVAPWSMGNPYTYYPASRWVGEPGLGGLPLSQGMYLGASVVALAMAAFGWERPRAQRRKYVVSLALAILFGATLLVSMGRYTPAHALLRAMVRPLAYMRFPEKYFVLPALLLAWLAALGTTRVLAGGPQPWRRTAGLALLLVLLAALAPLLFPPDWRGYVSGGASRGAVAVLAILGTQWLVARRPRLAQVLVVATAFFDLASACWPIQEFASLDLALSRPPAARAILLDRGRRPEPPRFHLDGGTSQEVWKHVRASSQAEVEAIFMQMLNANLPAVCGIASVPGYDAALSPAQTALWAQATNPHYDQLRLFSVDYVMLPRDQVTDRRAASAGLEPLMDPLPGARLYRVPDSLPRVFLAGRAEPATDDRAMARSAEPNVVTGGVVLLAPEVQSQFLDAPAGRAGDCTLTFFSNARLIASCTASRPALATFVEQYAPGWRARVDGVDAPLVRANVLMRAVPVGAGTHEIVLEYSQPGLRTGGLLSLLSVFLLVVLAVLMPAIRRQFGAGQTGGGCAPGRRTS